MNYSPTLTTLNPEIIRKQFPVLDQHINGHPLVYFDNAATTRKLMRVIQSLTDYYKGYNANIHRGVHTLAEKATLAFEQTRETVRSFITLRMWKKLFLYGGSQKPSILLLLPMEKLS